MELSFSTYSLAVRPSSRICQIVRELKRYLRTLFKESYPSENSEAHISLFEFRACNLFYQIIIEELRIALSRQKGFEIEFMNFGKFEDSKTLYVHILEQPSAEIVDLGTAIRPTFVELRRKKYVSSFRKKFRQPHMTLGRKLVGQLWKLVRDFDHKFHEKYFCDEVVLRRLNLKKGQFEIVETFKLLGRAKFDGIQMSIFAD